MGLMQAGSTAQVLSQAANIAQGLGSGSSATAGGFLQPYAPEGIEERLPTGGMVRALVGGRHVFRDCAATGETSESVEGFLSAVKDTQQLLKQRQKRSSS